MYHHLLFCYRADAPIIGYLLEYCSEREFAACYDEGGHCFGDINADVPTPKRLSWELNDEVCAPNCLFVLQTSVKANTVEHLLSEPLCSRAAKKKVFG